MTSKQQRWVAALAALVVFVLLAWILGRFLPLGDGERFALRFGLVALGLLSAGAILWYLRPRDAAAAAPKGDDALLALEAARARMGRGQLDARPLVLVLGTEGSGKTTIVARSGLDPELLAGEGAGTDVPPRTTAANVWLTKPGVLLEVAGPVFGDAARWRGLVRALRTSGLTAALGRGEPAGRAAVLCVPCDLFYDGGNGEQLDALAQLARQRLAEATRELGVRLPVYVLFTRADRVPHFEAWTAPFTRDEVRAPLGAALPWDDAPAGGHAERLAPRLERAFAAIEGALASRRLELLGRESVAERRLAAYEFPRELRKLAPAATRLLVELSRPMQLGASAQLRGFYFVGARPVLVSDVALASAASAAASAAANAPVAAAAAPASGRADATGLFQRGAGAPPAPPTLPAAAALGGYAPPAARKVPQWSFLDRLFPDVIFADPGAAAAARGGARVFGARRALLGGGIAAAVAACLAVGISFGGNLALVHDARDAARAVAALPPLQAPPGTIALPNPEALRTLDRLRAVLARLDSLETAGRPWHLGWGLWRGGEALAAGRTVWLEGYRTQLHAAAWGALVDSLRALPDQPAPTDDYQRGYDRLKAYMLGTTEHARSTPEFLAPVLLASWQRGQATDAEATALAREQFAFYARTLARENPFPQAADAALVARARGYLAHFAGTERIYQYMLAEASKAVPPARLAELAPGAPGVVNAADVPGAFTAKGWAFMDGAFRDSDRFLAGEQWVVGDAGVLAPGDRARVLAELRTRYRADYVERWRGFLRAAAVARPGSLKGVSQQLGVIGGAQSPVLAAIALAARNTAVDSGMAAAFQPAQAVTPADVPDKFVNEKNQPYANALLALQGAIEQLATLPPPTDTASTQALVAAAQQALTQATTAKVAARQLAQAFAVDPEAAQVAPAVTTLLEAPIDAAEGALRPVLGTRAPAPRKVAGAGGGGGAPPMTPKEAAAATQVLNERGRALCAAMGPVLAKFPFAADAQAEATPADVAALLAPGTGQLWVFQQERLQGLLEKQGGQWVPAPGAPIALSQQFVSFFNKAAQASAALFAAGGDQPRLGFTARAVATDKAPTITLSQGAQAQRFTKSSPPAQFVWPSATGREASLYAEGNSRLLGLRGGKTKPIARATGDWAMFRVVAQAQKTEGEGGALKAEFASGDFGPIVVEFGFPSGMPVLKRGWLGGVGCAAQVTK